MRRICLVRENVNYFHGRLAEGSRDGTTGSSSGGARATQAMGAVERSRDGAADSSAGARWARRRLAANGWREAR